MHSARAWLQRAQREISWFLRRAHAHLLRASSNIVRQREKLHACESGKKDTCDRANRAWCRNYRRTRAIYLLRSRAESGRWCLCGYNGECDGFGAPRWLWPRCREPANYASNRFPFLRPIRFAHNSVASPCLTPCIDRHIIGTSSAFILDVLLLSFPVCELDGRLMFFSACCGNFMQYF